MVKTMLVTDWWFFFFWFYNLWKLFYLCKKNILFQRNIVFSTICPFFSDFISVLLVWLFLQKMFIFVEKTARINKFLTKKINKNYLPHWSYMKHLLSSKTILSKKIVPKKSSMKMNFYNKTGIKKVLGEDDKQVRNLFKRLRLI